MLTIEADNRLTIRIEYSIVSLFFYCLASKDTSLSIRSL
mgnify:FL=1